MQFALNEDGERTHISETIRGFGHYFCPLCLADVTPRKGERNAHHFSHRPGSPCSDTWAKDYEMSEWHESWQEEFPKENREVTVTLAGVSHRADILTGKTVIEFQHSPLSAETFDKRNAFYHGLEYKIVWLFDFTEEYDAGKIKKVNDYRYTWSRMPGTFSHLDLKSSHIEVFFQFSKEGKGIVKADPSSVFYMNSINASEIFDRNGFLDYFRTNGSFALPIHGDITQDDEYKEFCHTFGLDKMKKNPQQARAVQTIDGATLILAVPGSGKTTVLINRLGYMIKCRHIKANSILALTYTKSAAAEMKNRFEKIFGRSDGIPDFRTLNSLAYEIATKENDYPLSQASNYDISGYLRAIYTQKEVGEYPTDGELKQAQTSISYIKNMMLSKDDCNDLVIWGMKAYEIYELYQEKLRQAGQMDFDDQMTIALNILLKKPDVLLKYQEKYNYVCVDEAQDTSLIQYRIIQLLVKEHHNIFMVGDEDQSIYRFRAAYPQALLDFEKDYANPFILKMEINYRSHSEIVEQSNRFIAKNTKRYEKAATSYKGEGGYVELIHAANQIAQFDETLRISKAAVSNESSIAFLARNNSSLLPVIDDLLAEKIPFSVRKQEDHLFDGPVVNDIKAFFRLLIDPFDTESFMTIYRKLYIRKSDATGACNMSSSQKISCFDALIKYRNYDRRNDNGASEGIKNQFLSMQGKTAYECLEMISSFWYSDYLTKKRSGKADLNALLILARKDMDAKSFLTHIEQFGEKYKNLPDKPSDEKPEKIILSTIHSSKGLAYDEVYLIDVFDGLFPAVDENADPEEQLEQREEERRVFYVGMTRARKRLSIFVLDDSPHSFADCIKAEERKAEQITTINRTESQYSIDDVCDKIFFTKDGHDTFVAKCPGVSSSDKISCADCRKCQYHATSKPFINDEFCNQELVSGCFCRFVDILGIMDIENDAVLDIKRDELGQITYLKIMLEGGEYEYNLPKQFCAYNLQALINMVDVNAYVIFRNVENGWRALMSKSDVDYYKSRPSWPFYQARFGKDGTELQKQQKKQVYAANYPVWIIEYVK